MDNRTVIAHKYLPTHFPINFTLILYLFLDRFDAPGWAWGGQVYVSFSGSVLLWIRSALTNYRLNLTIPKGIQMIREEMEKFSKLFNEAFGRPIASCLVLTNKGEPQLCITVNGKTLIVDSGLTRAFLDGVKLPDIDMDYRGLLIG